MLRRTLFGVNRSITITLKWYYLGVTARKEFPPLLKRLLSIRDKLLEAEGLVLGARHWVSLWVIGGAFNTAELYEYFRPKGHPQIWAKIVLNRIHPPKFSFVMWLAVWEGCQPWIDCNSWRWIWLVNCVIVMRKIFITCSLHAPLLRRYGRHQQMGKTSKEYDYNPKQPEMASEGKPRVILEVHLEEIMPSGNDVLFMEM